ncbi:MAG TPA: amino acid permease [Terriglobales bacterium]|jgi:L-asparagine transporter-like permease|nr:amino acid permease [Terriglobales bacterium]
MAADPVPLPDLSEEAIAREHGLARQLSERQLSMIAIGGAIGTGLFLGSALAVRTAGPGVILSYIFTSGIALLLMWCLSEMAVAHPTAGSFGVYADLYLSPWAGFVVRYTYWAAESIAAGGEAVAAAIYTQWWFPHTPTWAWVVFYSAALIVVNARSVGAFGTFEYWFSTIKVSAIVVFIVLGAGILFGIHQKRPIGLDNFRAHGGFLPNGWLGVWLALAFVIFSFIGTEVVAVTAGEAKDPERSVPRAMRTMLARLVIFYVGAITILVGVIPWTEVQPGQNITVSPFVRVFDLMHVPVAAGIINFVVLTAALSGMNCCLYLCTRMIFSLARGGYAPALLGRVSESGAPIPAVMASAGGLAIAIIMAISVPGSAYVYMFGIALFGGLFVWLMIFITHLSFRKHWVAKGGRTLPVRTPLFPVTTILGGTAVLAIIISTWWVDGMRPTLESGIPWLALLTAGYAFWARNQKRRVERNR